MKIDIKQSDLSVDITIDYPNLVAGNYIPFLWDLNTNLWNDEMRFWDYSGTETIFVRFINQYTNKVSDMPTTILFSNSRYTELNILIDSDFKLQDDGFYNTYLFITDNSDSVVLMEWVSYIDIEGRKPQHKSFNPENEGRKIKYFNGQ